MKKYLFGLLLLAATALSVSTQKTQVTKPSAVETNIRKEVAYLASDKLEGRRTGEAGATTAAGYIANGFATLSLKPGARTKTGKFSYMQLFPYVTGVEPAKTGNNFTLELTQGDGNRVKVENLVPAEAVGFSPNGTVRSAGVVFAGYGILSSELKFDDYKFNDKDIDVRGKVVLVFDGYPDYDSPQSTFRKFDARTKALIAKDKGAVGVLLISREAKFEDDKLNQLKYDQTMGEAALPTFVISRNTAENILGVKTVDLAMIESLIAMSKDPAVRTNYSYLDTKPVVSFSVQMVKKKAAAYNIIGILPGTDPKLKDEAIVIGAHYDHLGHGGPGSLAANSTEVHHGADDNASGTSAMIELARIFKNKGGNKRTLIFVAFSGEEEGLLGSKAYVADPAWPLEKTVAMLNLDMVGRLNENKLNVGGIGTASEWKSLVQSSNVNDEAGLIIAKLPESNRPKNESANLTRFALALSDDGYGPSDHASFYGKNVPVLFFFTGTHADYHKPSDTADKINYVGEAKIVTYIAAITRAIDENPKRPTFTVAKSTGTGGGRSGFNISLGTIPGYGDSTDGMVVDGVRDNSPASRAGIRPGDKIVKLNGKDVRNVADYTFVLGTMKAGEEYDIIVKRGSELLPLKITPVKRQ